MEGKWIFAGGLSVELGEKIVQCFRIYLVP